MHRYTAICPHCKQSSVTFYPKLQKTTRHECLKCRKVIIHKLADLTPEQEEARWKRFEDFYNKKEKEI